MNSQFEGVPLFFECEAKVCVMDDAVAHSLRSLFNPWHPVAERAYRRRARNGGTIGWTGWGLGRYNNMKLYDNDDDTEDEVKE